VSHRVSSTAAAFAAVLVLAGVAVAQERECGFDLKDWCPAPAGDPCGRHKNAAECRGDFNCRALTYRGPTTIACIADRRGFSLNCPVVGCVSITPQNKGRNP
jgi:hypothetical protein